MTYNPYANQQNGAPNVVRPAGSGYSTADYSSTVPNNNFTAHVPVVAEALPTHQFLARIDAARNDINALTSYISEVATLHQRALTRTEPDSALETLVTRTQVLNTRIRDQIKTLEQDAARSANSTKTTQVNALRNDFKAQLSAYQREEVEYKKRFQEQIARQYRIVNPGATEAEVREAAQADWGNEGVFQTALQSNRTGHAASALGAVRSRHNDIQRIERTLIELAQLFADLNEQVMVHDYTVQAIEDRSEQTQKNTKAANIQMDKGITHAKTRRKLKWCCCCLFILIIIAVVVACLVVFVFNKNKDNPASPPAPTAG